MSTENNGYLDSDQTIVNYGIRELGCSFQQLLRDDPSRMLRNWRKCRKSAQTTAIGTTVLGAGAVCAGVFTGALPVLIAGVAVAAGSGLLVRHHAAGAEACELEATILDECRPILTLLAELERRGANPSDLVSVYDRLVRAALANQLQPTDQAALKEFFNRELEASQVFANLSGVKTGLSVPARRDDADRPSEWELPAAVEPQDAAASFSPTGETVEGEAMTGPVTVAAPPPCPIAHLIGDRLRTSLIVAVSGGGKDILLSNALRKFLAAHPAFQVVVMDCKDDAKEHAYYGGLPNVTVHRLNVAIASDGEVVEWVDGCLEQFLHLPERALLICNEGTLIRAKSQRYVDAVGGLVSSGDSREKYCWEAGQSAHTDDLKINGAARSRFRVLIIGMKGEEMQIEAVLQAKFVADSARNMQDIKGQMMRSPVGRAWCDGQRWHPMPMLTNYSGWNRDERKAIGQPTAAPAPTPTPAPTPSPTPSPTPQPQDDRAQLERLFRAESVEPIAPSTGSSPTTEPLEKLARYLQSKEKIDFRTLSKNWGRNHNFSDDSLKELLIRLESQGRIAVCNDAIFWKG